MTADADLLVVGAGPSGLAAAIHAARSGLSVIALDAHTGTLDKACGEGLMPGAVEALGRLGVTPSESFPFHGVRYIDGRHSAEGHFARGTGLGVRRVILHEALAAKARALGVRRVQARVDGVCQDADGVVAAGLRGRWLIAADGLRSPIRQQLGLDLPPRRSPRVGLRRHFRRAPRDPMVEVHWSPDAEAYITPVGPDHVGVAFLFFPDRLPPVPAGSTRYDTLMAGFPVLREWLDGAEPRSKLAGAGPFERRVRARVAGRVLLVGDAAGYLDPLTGEGLRLGFEAAQAAVGCLRSGRLGDYEAAWRAIARRYWWMTAGLLRVARSRRLRRAIVPVASACPPLMSAAIRVLGDTRGTPRLAAASSAMPHRRESM